MRKKSKARRFVITSAQCGATVNMRFFNTLLNYCRINDAQLMVIPLAGITVKDDEIDQVLLEYKVTQNTPLNRKVMVSTFKISPTASDPLNGLARVTEHTTIFGSPKLASRPVPTSSIRLPKLITTTGCVTDPYYTHSRIGDIAAKDHTYSAIVVEIKDQTLYHLRQLEANGNGEVNDLFMHYTSSTVFPVKLAGLVLGDLHVDAECPKVRGVTMEIIEMGRPEQLVVHDVLDAYSINHHHEKDIILRARKGEKNQDCLTGELDRVFDRLLDFFTYKHKPNKVLVVDSNHDRALDRYLKEGRFIHDRKNYRIALQLSLSLLNGRRPLEAFFKDICKKRSAGTNRQKIEKIRFLDCDEDYFISNILVSNHGDLGANGARPSIKTQEISAKKSVIGHSHVPNIFHKVWQVGTSTRLKLEYNKGFSSWVNSHVFIYPDGTRQLINIIDGEWKI